MRKSHPRRSIEETLGLLLSKTDPKTKEKPEFQAWLQEKYKLAENMMQIQAKSKWSTRMKQTKKVISRLKRGLTALLFKRAQQVFAPVANKTLHTFNKQIINRN